MSDLPWPHPMNSHKGHSSIASTGAGIRRWTLNYRLCITLNIVPRPFCPSVCCSTNAGEGLVKFLTCSDVLGHWVDVWRGTFPEVSALLITTTENAAIELLTSSSLGRQLSNWDVDIRQSWQCFSDSESHLIVVQQECATLPNVHPLHIQWNPHWLAEGMILVIVAYIVQSWTCSLVPLQYRWGRPGYYLSHKQQRFLSMQIKWGREVPTATVHVKRWLIPSIPKEWYLCCSDLQPLAGHYKQRSPAGPSPIYLPR